jgi:hypothetical protein
VPAMALKNVIITTVKPLPICANNGPGQAPVMAQPKPKIKPPYICPLLNVLGVITICSPSSVLMFIFLI